MNWPLLYNSLLVAGLTMLVACGLGLAAAVFAAGLPSSWRMRFFALALVVLALPPFLTVNCWLHLLGNTGLWRGWLPFNIYSLGGTVWVLSLMTWPITLLAVWSAWQRLEAPQLESDPAVRGWALFRGLLFPLARPALGQAALLTFVLALNNFSVPSILQVKVFSSEVWVRFSATFDPLGALLLAWPLLLAPTLLLLWLWRREIPWPRLRGGVPPALLRQQVGRRWYLGCGVAAIALVGLSAGIPLGELVWFPRTWTELPGAFAAGRGAAWNSLSLSFVSAVAIIGLALLGAVVGRRPGTRPQAGYGGVWFLLLPFLAPGVFLGIALIFGLNRPSLAVVYETSAVVVLAFVLRYLGLGCVPVRQAMDATDPELSDAARLEGARPSQMLRWVWWPQIAPQVVAAGYVIYLLCLWDVESIVLVYPPGGETLALRVFNLLHYGHNPEVNALCLILLGIALAPLFLFKAGTAAAVCVRRGLYSGRRGLLILTALAAAVLADGCAPAANPKETPLQSSLFSSVQVIGSRGAGLGQFLKPRSVAVDGQDDVYAVDMTGRVQRFSSNGTFQLSWQMPQTDLGKAKGMCRDQDGNIVVLEPHYQRVNVFKPGGELVSQWGHRGTNFGQFTLPRAVAINSRNEAFVSEYGAWDRVQRFSSNRDVCLNSFGQAGAGPGQFNRPEGLCVDAQGLVYVADSCNHRVQVFTAEGRLLRVYGKPGAGLGELSYPYDICVDAQGRQYVCEFGNSRVQVFDAADQPIEILGGPGAAPGRFSNPWGVALDSVGNLYVADSQNHRLQKFIRRVGQSLAGKNGKSAGTAPGS